MVVKIINWTFGITVTLVALGLIAYISPIAALIVGVLLVCALVALFHDPAPKDDDR